MLSVVIFAALMTAASAFDANVYGGAWEVVGGSTGIPPTQSYGHATWVPGYLLILGKFRAREPPRAPMKTNANPNPSTPLTLTK